MASTKSNSVPSPESVHEAWLSQRAELERDLFDGWTPDVPSAPVVTRPQAVAEVVSICLSEVAPQSPDARGVVREPATERIDNDMARQQEWLRQSNAAAVEQRVEHQQRVAETLSQKREVFVQDLARQRAALEQELSSREAAWATQRDREWTALRTAKEVQDVAQQRLKDDLAAQRLREREELLHWRRQAEAEFAEARRLAEQERLNQQQEFARQRETEMAQLRREREEFDARVRQVQSEIAYARQHQEDELRQARDVHSAQLRAERAELDKLRDAWVEKFHREQVVLENGLQFFGQHLSRVSDELRVAQRGLQAVSESAVEAHPSTRLFESSVPVVCTRSEEPTILNLEQIRERLNELKRPQRAAA